MTQAILAGFLIGIGDIALMSSENFYVGSFLFAVALMTIIYFELPLFTGKIGFVINDHNWAGCVIALIFNVIGATLAVWLYKMMYVGNKLDIREVAIAKYGKGFLTLFIAGILCNVLIHLAVSTKHTVIVILCVMTFIICGFEHSIADVPYALIGFNWQKLLGWLCVLAGNTVGGISTEFMLKFLKEDPGSNESLDDPTNSSLESNNQDDDVIDGEYQQIPPDPASAISGLFGGFTMPSFEENQDNSGGND